MLVVNYWDNNIWKRKGTDKTNNSTSQKSQKSGSFCYMINYHSNSSVSVHKYHKWKDLQKFWVVHKAQLLQDSHLQVQVTLCFSAHVDTTRALRMNAELLCSRTWGPNLGTGRCLYHLLYNVRTKPQSHCCPVLLCTQPVRPWVYVDEHGKNPQSLEKPWDHVNPLPISFNIFQSMTSDIHCNLHGTSTVLKSHQAGKVTSSPCHSGDIDKSHQVVESHIKEEKSPWHGLFHL